ncbi:DUF3999 domain-containing protein [Luteimonas aquatica]|uniref:DUF3999 domain-containing protein n=1 Tax=Luteimonas aquatica TaxID=450364 RepID=UPI001F57DD9F|nr:DUF3999 domain-containing protein [Luteimonas aquatica]
MKHAIWLSLLLPLAAGAAAREDYARQWPLALQNADSGAYRVELTPEIYRSVQSAALRDLDVVNADGVAVPADVFAAEQSGPDTARETELPWFPLPAGEGGTAGDLSILAERNADGSVRNLQARATTTAAAGADTGWLIDASRLRDPILDLQLQWAPVDAPLDRPYRLEGSDDLREWRTLNARAQLVDLNNAGHRLRQDRVDVNAAAHYLRLTPLRRAGAPKLLAVRARLATVAAQPWQWRELAGRRTRDANGDEAIEYELDGRFPIERVDLQLAANDGGEWMLESRAGPEQAWTSAADWVAYRVDDGERSNRSPPQPLSAPTRDAHWRLRGRNGLPAGAAPRLRLGYLPESLVFLAQGRAPYALVAGSRRTQRQAAPLSQMLDALRQARGAQWRPAAATVGPGRELGGASALQPAEKPRDWKAWLLWGVLIAAAALVAGFALSLLRKPRSGPS